MAIAHYPKSEIIQVGNYLSLQAESSLDSVVLQLIADWLKIATSWPEKELYQLASKIQSLNYLDKLSYTTYLVTDCC